MPRARLRIALFGLLWLAVSLPAACAWAQAPSPPAASGEAVYQRVVERVRRAYQDCDPGTLARLPIGLFDSGTGGLTVLEQILRLDAFDNATHQPRPGGDGRPDFEAERFVFLADQANMPYGQYRSAGKTEFLRELVLKDAELLVRAKAMVIACNTATAYGQDLVARMLNDAAAPVALLGVIEAGARGALEAIEPGRPATIGVLATCGTVQSEAYPATLRRLAAAPLSIIQQGSVGLAGAIDARPEFLDPAAKAPRPGYCGPGLNNDQAPLDVRRLARCHFDFSAGQMLCQGDPRDPRELQINSVANYVAYDTTMLLERVRQANPPAPLRAVILGCTHFPLVADLIGRELRRLYDYQEEGRYVYRSCMAPHVALVDPAQTVARQLYVALARAGRLASAPAGPGPRARFYITVPNSEYPGAALAEGGGFTYDYKYGRTPGLDGADVRYVPLGCEHLGPAAWQRLERQVPRTFELLKP